MKTLSIFILTLAACVGFFFFVPHHRRNENTFKPCTLAEIYGQVFREWPDVPSPRVAYFLLFGLIGVATAFYPVLFIILARYASPAAGQPGGALFVFGGLVAIVGSAVNFLAILVSHMNFGFGGGGSTREQTPFCWVIPLVQLVFALASFTAGCSGTVASLLVRLVR